MCMATLARDDKYIWGLLTTKRFDVAMFWLHDYWKMMQNMGQLSSGPCLLLLIELNTQKFLDGNRGQSLDRGTCMLATSMIMEEIFCGTDSFKYRPCSRRCSWRSTSSALLSTTPTWTCRGTCTSPTWTRRCSSGYTEIGRGQLSCT